MHPILFYLGRFPVPTYGIAMMAALFFALWVVKVHAQREGLHAERVQDALMVGVIAGLLLARIFEAVINWDRYFGPNGRPSQLIYSFGVYYGGVIGAILGGGYWFHRVKIPYLQGLDMVGLLGASLVGVGRWGCLMSGCCWGAPTSLPWSITFPKLAQDIHAGLPSCALHPVQVYESLLSFGILGVLAWLHRRKRFHGQILCAYLVLYGIVRFGLERVRGDIDRGEILGMSTSSLISILMVVGAAVLWVVLAQRHRAAGAPDVLPAPVPAAPAPRRGARS